MNNGTPIFRNHLQPCHYAHLREVDSPEAQPREENIYAIAQRLLMKQIDGLFDGLPTVGTGPSILHLGMSLRDAHLQRGVRHFKRNEFLPVLRPRQSPS